MKRNIFITTLILLLAGMNLRAQEMWVTQVSGTDRILYSVDFINANNGIAVGEAGTILKTNDGGAGWQSITTSFTNDLNGVCFYDVNHAVAVGDGGQIIVSENGGIDWTSHWLPGIQWDLFAVDITPDGKGIASGKHSTMLYTTNGGLNWSIIQEQIPGFCCSVRRLNDSITFVFGMGRLGTNTIHKLVNDVVTEENNFYVDHLMDCWEGFIFDGYAFDESSLVTAGRITRYSLAGAITSIQELTDTCWNSSFTIDSCEFHGVDFIGNYGIAVGGAMELIPERTIIMETNDGGATWTNSYNTDGKSPNLKDVKLIGNVAYAVGHDGVIMKKVTGTNVTLHQREDTHLSISPNPASDNFEISFTLSSAESVCIDMYDMNGRLINTPFSGKLAAGSHRITNPLTKSSGIAPRPGVYVIRLLAGNTVNTAKLIIR